MLRHTDQAAAELLQRDLARTDAIWEASFPRFLAKPTAAIAEVCLKVLAHRSKLLGVEGRPVDDDLFDTDRYPDWLKPDSPSPGDEPPASPSAALSPNDPPAGGSPQALLAEALRAS